MRLNKYINLYVKKSVLVLVLFSSLCCGTVFGKAKFNEKALELRFVVVEEALNLLGKPYVYGATGPDAFDCSGFIGYIVKKYLYYQLPRTAADIYEKCRKVSKSELEMGDLVFFKSNRFSKIDHVGIYVGKNQFISALSDGPKAGISISKLDGSYWKPRFYAVGRFIPSAKAE